jgi:hypothetical protein
MSAMDLIDFDFGQAEIDLSTLTSIAPLHWDDPTFDTHLFEDGLDLLPNDFESFFSSGSPTEHSSTMRRGRVLGNDLAAFIRPDPSIQFMAISGLESIGETLNLDRPLMDALDPQLLVNPASQNDLALSALAAFQSPELLTSNSPPTMPLGPPSSVQPPTPPFPLYGALPLWGNTAEATIDIPFPLEQATRALHHNVSSVDSVTTQPAIAENHPWQITTTSRIGSSRPIKAAGKQMKRPKRATLEHKSRKPGEIIPGRHLWDSKSGGPVVPVRKRASDSRRKDIQQPKAFRACLRCSMLKKQASLPLSAFKSYQID